MVTLRPADESDSSNLWEWRNDAATRAASLDTRHVTWADHRRWLAASLRNSKRLILVATDESQTKVGMVRFDFGHTKAAMVSITVAPEWRGRGVGRVLLRDAIELVRMNRLCEEFTAQVRANNGPSISIFEGEGFVRVSAIGDVVTLRT